MMKDNFFELRVLISNLKKLKEERNLSYEDIGQATDLNRTSVFKIFNTINAPSIAFLAKFANYLNVPLYSFFIPNEEFLREYYTDLLKERLAKLNEDSIALAEKCQIHPLRFNDILKARVTPTSDEISAIFDTLGLDYEGTYTFENKDIILKQILGNYGLIDDQQESLIEYIKTLKK